jgi:hypothetical protein
MYSFIYFFFNSLSTVFIKYVFLSFMFVLRIYFNFYLYVAKNNTFLFQFFSIIQFPAVHVNL